MDPGKCASNRKKIVLLVLIHISLTSATLDIDSPEEVSLYLKEKYSKFLP